MSTKHTYLNNANPLYVEDLFKKYQNDPLSVDEKWRIFFEGYELAKESGLTETLEGGERFDRESQVTKLIHAYRSRGHMVADINPLEAPGKLEDLEKEYYFLNDNDLKTLFNAGNNLRIGPATLEAIIDHLKKTYASGMGVEFVHCNNTEIRQWIYKTIEPGASNPHFSPEKKIRMLTHLYRANLFEDFLHKKYVGQKRFGLEGMEALIPGLISVIHKGAELGGEEFVIGMAHRGRLNVLVNILNKAFYNLFTEFEGGELSKTLQGNGDVKYHLGQSADVEYNDKKIHLSMAFNPSHLEAVSTVVQGIVRGKTSKYYNNQNDKVVPIIIHGDASVAGQGIVYELANMSQLEGFNNGGSIHVVLNNQLGFTANAKESRSSHYCTEVAKITDSPVFHVNANDVEKVVYAFELAMELRHQFQIDVWIELVGYRRRGHNEGDEPRFTSPVMYDKIDKMPPVTEIYFKKLQEEKVVTPEQVDGIIQEYSNALEKDLDRARKKKSNIELNTLSRFWQDIRHAEDKDFVKSIPTGVDKKVLDGLVKKLSEIPPHFKINGKILKLIESREELYTKGKKIDWAMGEQLAMATLLHEGTSVRLSGQDSERGTFSHRHAILKDVETENTHIPLGTCLRENAQLRIFNTLLSEYAVLGFEYGYSLTRPHSLAMWEAQFGDFANGAQIIIDQFIATGEVKWQRHSGLVLLLPHGYEGMGPEHSSARLERFLQLCSANNMYVVYPSSPANFFHLIRRQVRNRFRKPLIVMSPKSMLRNPDAVSPVSEISRSGSRFQEIIDEEIDVKKVKRLVLCSGKVFYDLAAYRKEKGRTDEVALVRIEQLYPLAMEQLQSVREKYSKAKEIFWVQEEPKNMGAWTFIKESLPDWKFDACISRRHSSSPASGSFSVHKANQERIIRETID